MTKHEEYYIKMVEENQEVFNAFMEIHDKYAKDYKTWQTEFNNQGKKVVEIIREWERRLCQHSERGQYGKFSGSLSEKFWIIVRKDFPKIDFVGVK